MQFAGILRGAQVSDTTASPSPSVATNTAMAVILAISFSHMLNDIMQSLLSAIYPMLKDGYRLDFWQIGMLTLTFQVTASLFQPLVGIYTDKRPLPYSLPFGMGSTLIGLVVLAYASNYWLLLTGAAFIGFGSAVFHPEASRVARMASGGRYGLAQSLFQVGGNFGQSIGPLLAAFIVVPLGQSSVAWFSLAALLGMGVLWQVSNWYSRNRVAVATNVSSAVIAISRSRLVIALVVLVALTFSKNVYMASISSYYTFYVIDKFGVSVQDSQVFLFLFLFAAALGTVIGGPIGDRYGAKFVIWLSILGAVPFTLGSNQTKTLIRAVGETKRDLLDSLAKLRLQVQVDVTDAAGNRSRSRSFLPL